VGAGDTITAEVQFLSSSGNTSTFQLTITDTPAGGGQTRTFSTTQTIKSAAQSSAEWIVEETGTLSNFSPVTFTNAQATIKTSGGTVTGTIGTFLDGDSSTVVNKINIAANHKGTYLDSTSELNSTGDGFTVYYGPTVPASAVNGGGLHGPMERLADDPLGAGVVDPGSGAAQTAVESSSPTPTNPFLATEAVVPTGASLSSNNVERTLGRSTVVGGSLADAEGQPGAGLSSFELSPMPATPVPHAEVPGQGEAMAGAPFDSNLEPIATAGSPFEQPAVALSLPPAFSEDPHWDHLLCALALAAYVPYLQKPRKKEERSRVR
jgi:hypothetical protein